MRYWSPIAEGAGVVTVSGNTFHGGDSMMFFVGQYTQDADRFTLTATTAMHTRTSRVASAIGVEGAEVVASGTVNGDTASGVATAKEAPGIEVHFEAARLCD